MKTQFQQTFSKPSKTEYWDAIYDRPDFYGECLRLRMNKTMAWLDGLHLDGCARILDAGCGAGRQLSEAVRKGYDTVGMDFSHPMLVKALGKLKSDDRQSTALCQGDLELIPFHDSSFDAVICLGVLTYLSSEVTALGELVRVLKPGGTLIVSIINKTRLVRFFDLPLLIKETFLKYYGKITSLSEDKAEVLHNSNLTSYFVPTMIKSLEHAGFFKVEYETVPLEMPTIFGEKVFTSDTSRRIAFLFEQNTNIPIVKTFGGMCIFKAEKIAA